MMRLTRRGFLLGSAAALVFGRASLGGVNALADTMSAPRRVAAIFYDDESGVVNRIVVTTGLANLKPHLPAKGEDSIILHPDEIVPGGVLDLPACCALVEAKRGKRSKGAR